MSILTFNMINGVRNACGINMMTSTGKNVVVA